MEYGDERQSWLKVGEENESQPLLYTAVKRKGRDA